MTPLVPFMVIAPEDGHTLAKVLRSRLHESGPSWKVVRSLIEARRVRIDDDVCTDEARRLKEGELVELLAQPKPLPKEAHPERLVVRHLDGHVVVVEKPAGVNSVRHPSELEWSEQRRQLVPTLQDLATWAVARRHNVRPNTLPPLRIVHRLDKETSGLLVFARSADAERGLGLQFKMHTVSRRYLTLIAGAMSPQTIASILVKDRGDGRRGSSTFPGPGKRAVTHVLPVETLPGFTLLECRLETGRTHQIRIHLSEAGHPVCGDKVYCKRPTGEVVADASLAPRLMLHATELGFEHPVTGARLHFDMPMPPDMVQVLARLRNPANRQ